MGNYKQNLNIALLFSKYKQYESHQVFYKIQCCLYLSMMSPELIGERMEAERLYDSVNILLFLQVKLINSEY